MGTFPLPPPSPTGTLTEPVLDMPALLDCPPAGKGEIEVVLDIAVLMMPFPAAASASGFAEDSLEWGLRAFPGFVHAASCLGMFSIMDTCLWPETP